MVGMAVADLAPLGPRSGVEAPLDLGMRPWGTCTPPPSYLTQTPNHSQARKGGNRVREERWVRRHGPKSLLPFEARARPYGLHHATKFVLRVFTSKKVQGCTANCSSELRCCASPWTKSMATRFTVSLPSNGSPSSLDRVATMGVGVWCWGAAEAHH
jgi:hypothetical protein